MASSLYAVKSQSQVGGKEVKLRNFKNLSKGEQDGLLGTINTECTNPKYWESVLKGQLRWQAFLSVKTDQEARGETRIMDRSGIGSPLAMVAARSDRRRMGGHIPVDKLVFDPNNQVLRIPQDPPSWLYGTEKPPRPQLWNLD